MAISRHEDRIILGRMFGGALAGAILLAGSVGAKPMAALFAPTRIDVAVAAPAPAPSGGLPTTSLDPILRDAKMGVYFQVALGARTTLNETVKVYLDGVLIAQRSLILSGAVAPHEELILDAAFQVPGLAGPHAVRVITTGSIASDRTFVLAF